MQDNKPGNLSWLRSQKYTKVSDNWKIHITFKNQHNDKWNYV